MFERPGHPYLVRLLEGPPMVEVNVAVRRDASRSPDPWRRTLVLDGRVTARGW